MSNSLANNAFWVLDACNSPSESGFGGILVLLGAQQHRRKNLMLHISLNRTLAWKREPELYAAMAEWSIFC